MHVQAGCQYRLYALRTPNSKSHTVISLDFIPAGSFVVEYVGLYKGVSHAERESRQSEDDLPVSKCAVALKT